MRVFNRGQLVLGMLLVAACGGSDSKSLGASYGEISNAVQNPTGTVSASTAPSVATEYEKISGSDVSSLGAGLRRKQSGSQSVSCDSGGTVSVNVAGNQDAMEIDYTYNSCCYDPCCFAGGGNTYYAGTGSTDVNDFNYCASYDFTATCAGEGVSHVAYEGCLGGVNGWTYVVRADGESFAVTGYYDSASGGSLEITGDNGSFSCTYASDGSGSCTASTGETFDF